MKESNNTEAQILKAAEEEFLSKGYAGARTTSIAEKAGVTHAMLHYYFRTKEHLFEEIIKSKFNVISQIVFAALGDSDLPLLERVRQGVGRHFDFLAANRQMPRFILTEAGSNPQLLEKFLGGFKERISGALADLQRMIDEGAARGENRRVDAMDLLLDIVSLNVFPFAAGPAIEPLTGAGLTPEFLAARREENINTILNKLRP